MNIGAVAARIAADQSALLDQSGAWTARAKELDELPLSKYLESLSTSTERWVIDLLALAYLCEHGIAPDRQSSLNLVDAIGTDTAQPFGPFGHGGGIYKVNVGGAKFTVVIVFPILHENADHFVALLFQ